jgi:putative PEP-CTERM system TPR-repeat lipoprotein
MYAADLFELANNKFNEHDYDEAKIHLKNLIKEQPNNLSARFLMVDLLLAQDQASLAEIELNIIDGLGGDYQQITLRRSEALLMQYKYNEILSLFRDDYFDEVFAAKASVQKGLAHLGLRQLQLSETAFNDALALNPSNLDANLGLAQVKVNFFQYNAASEIVEQVIRSPFPPVKAWVLKATIEQSKGNVDVALESINMALMANPENIQAQTLRATLLFENQDFIGAQNDVSRILKELPNEPKAKFIQAALAIKKNDIDSSNRLIDEIAETLAKVSEEALTTNPSYLYLAGIIFYQQNQYVLAREYFSQYIEIDRFNVNAKILLARIHMEQGDYTIAKSQLIKINIEHLDNIQVLRLLGVCFLELKQYHQALAYFNQVKSLQPSGSVDIQMAKVNLSLNKNLLAINLLKEGDFNPTQQVLASFLLVQAYLKERKPELALKISLKLSASKPNDAEFLHHLGFVYQSIGDFENAKLSYQQALSNDLQHIKSIISLAQISSIKGEAKEGLALLISALEVLPQNVQLLKAIATQYVRLGNTASATLMYQRALQHQPDNETLIMGFAKSLAKEGRVEDAIEEIKKFSLSQRNTASLHLLKGRLYISNKQLDLAISSYRDALKFDGDRSLIYFYIAKAYQMDRKFTDALKAYQKSISWAPSSPEPVIALAKYLNSESKTVEAIEALLDFEDPKSQSSRFQNVLAQSYFLNKNFLKAEKIYFKIQADQNISTTVGLALVYQQLNKNKQAIKLLNNALSNQTNNLAYLGTLGEIYIKDKQWQQAEEVYAKLLKINSNQPMLLNNAAFVAMSLSKFEQAKEFAMRSIALFDNSPDSLDTLGWIYYQTEMYTEALPLLRKALAIDYSNIEIKYHMSLTLKALGQDREAFNMLREVANTKMEFHDKALAKQTLELWAKP